jgi:hypothetical protein
MLKDRLRAALAVAGLRPVRSWPFVARRRRFRFAPTVVGEALLRPVVVKAANGPVPPDTPLGRIWKETGESDKWLHYFPFYEELLANHVGSPARVLEIGVQRGGSLRTWRRYLGDRAVIVGIDIDPACAAHDDPANGINVRIGSQGDPKLLKAVAAEFGPFDVIIDDGSHIASDIAASLNHLFGDALRPGGKYLIEDTHALYWDGFRNTRAGMGEMVAELTNLMHSHYWTNESAEKFRAKSEARIGEAEIPAIGPMIQRIEIMDSLLLIHKARDPAVLPVILTI